jgi:protein SCO1/2
VWDEETKQFAHPAGILVATPEGRISHYLFGVEYSPKDLRLALVDAAGGKVGNAVDQVLLYCYQYNPQTGRYSASILNLVRLGGLLTVVGLVGFILTVSMRRRGRPS